VASKHPTECPYVVRGEEIDPNFNEEIIAIHEGLPYTYYLHTDPLDDMKVQVQYCRLIGRVTWPMRCLKRYRDCPYRLVREQEIT
jgi:hypothetical protein